MTETCGRTACTGIANTVRAWTCAQARPPGLRRFPGLCVRGLLSILKIILEDFLSTFKSSCSLGAGAEHRQPRWRLETCPADPQDCPCADRPPHSPRSTVLLRWRTGAWRSGGMDAGVGPSGTACCLSGKMTCNQRLGGGSEGGAGQVLGRHPTASRPRFLCSASLRTEHHAAGLTDLITVSLQVGTIF